MKAEIYSESYHSYQIRIFKSGHGYIGVVSYGGRVRYTSGCDYGKEWHKRYLLGHLRWWVRDKGNKRRTRWRVRPFGGVGK